MCSLNSLRKTLAVFLLFLAFPAAAESSVINPRETPIVKVVQNNAESVVNISTERILLLREHPAWGSYGNEMDFFFGEYFGLLNRGRTRKLKLNSVGSGVIVDDSGLIVTNAHVVHMASNIYVILSDGTSAAGQVVFENLRDDLALIKIIPPKPLKAANFGETGDVMIGETVVAIGNPLGLENSVSAGIVSGKDRDLPSFRGEIVIEDLIQTDAPINPGNSGGALLNLNGDLVGINVAVVQNSQSIGFAIPIEKVKAAIEGHRKNKGFAIKHRKQRQLPPVSQAPSVTPPDEHDQWDPFAEMDRMRNEMDQLFQNLFSHKDRRGNTGMFNTDIFYSPQIDIEESDNGYVIELDISGLNKDKLEIDINNYSITISGETSGETKESGPAGTYHSQSFGSFLKTIPLPGDANPDQIETETKENTLIIRMPKK